MWQVKNLHRLIFVISVITTIVLVDFYSVRWSQQDTSLKAASCFLASSSLLQVMLKPLFPRLDGRAFQDMLKKRFQLLPIIKNFTSVKKQVLAMEESERVIRQQGELREVTTVAVCISALWTMDWLLLALSLGGYFLWDPQSSSAEGPRLQYMS